MNSVLIGLLENVAFWVLLVSIFGGYFTLRLANNYRDQAAFVDFPDSPDRYLIRARVLSVFFYLFLAVIFVSLSVLVFQLLQGTQPQAALLPAASTATATASPSPAPEEEEAPERVFITATPRPTYTPAPSPGPTLEVLGKARIGNTNYQGVNIRAIPSLDGDIIARLANRTEVEVLSTDEVIANGFTWLAVRMEDGRTGWVVAHYLVMLPTPAGD